MLFNILPADARGQSDAPERRAYLEQLRRVLPRSEPWETWLTRTGELPPDFGALPSQPDLPDPLAGVKDAEGWEARRNELKGLFHRWVLGTAPPAPDNLRAEVLSERQEEGATVRQVQLRFGPGHRATLRLELLLPKGDGPFPVFLTQHTHRSWALIALRRGYIGCVYSGADSQDDTDTFLPAYPGHDWSRLTRRAWAASRCIDYLLTVPQADSKQVALTGHSRNGKLSLIASALDERIAAVISSSSGAGGTMPARYYAEPHFGESIEKITRSFPEWFHPRLRFFSGREDKLPVDLHELVALSAPRPCLLSIALNDNVESSWALEETYRSAQRVYRLLGGEDRLRILWRPGGHETWPAVIERYLDWCDAQFGRGAYAFPERLIHPHDWDAWQKNSGERLDMAALPRRGPDHAPGREQVRAEVQKMLGEAPPRADNPGGGYGKEAAHIAALLRRPAPPPDDAVEKEQVVFGEYINADVYLPGGLREAGRKAPAVLWLHPFSSAQGYVAGYFDGEQVFRTLARQGFVVFCFDQIGYGRRIEEVEGFYRRHPRWSLLGKMVRDAQAALDVLPTLAYVDAKQIYGLGYSLGSLVGLHLAAVDDRLAGFASVCGPPPFRRDTPDKGTGGIRRWSHRHMLLPRLGLFAGQEDRIPYDVPDLLAALAPRPVLVVSPELDREARRADITGAVKAAQQVYAAQGASQHLQQLSPEDYNRLGAGTQGLVLEWLKKQTR